MRMAALIGFGMIGNDIAVCIVLVVMVVTVKRQAVGTALTKHLNKRWVVTDVLWVTRTAHMAI